jgi:hypothetical protein
MVFSYFLFGALSMVAVSLDWTDKIFFIGCLAIASGTLSLSLWMMLKKHLHLPAIGETPAISTK